MPNRAARRRQRERERRRDRPREPHRRLARCLAGRPEADDLRAVFEQVRSVAIDCYNKLHAARDHAARFHAGDHHFHLAAGRVVRMVAVDVRPRLDTGPDEDLPF